ncbi:stage II sporulation protein R [Candidatus Galacturonibacter soehngenii]|uniref:Stage II sporulation protein R n=1 Tax=Candidatus Galacturonatibacter soehngenii TaxID=2307010 RepID=A0A7V7QH95_9FIRM|nr:stage II sporulation protein R [Candidatus Galacturonibacter soehngenii]KAB1434280.1 stage II sporulation protein R [Candidatus Galacturonibacter soehngenii]
MKKKNHIIISLLVVIIGITLTSQVYISKANVSNTYSMQKLQSTLAQKIIRFHVIADNDTDESQQLKMKVKNETLKYMKTLLTGTEDLSTTRDILENNLENIKNFALDVVEKEGYEYNVSAEFENCYFPIKEYGSLIFPAGYYDALKIKLGKAEGRNWWCVMYPNLCFVEGSYAVVNDEVKETLEGMLTPDEYHMLLQGNNTKISFKYLKFLNN